MKNKNCAFFLVKKRTKIGTTIFDVENFDEKNGKNLK